MKDRPLLLLALLIVAQRLLFLLFFPPVYEPDSALYAELGRALASGAAFESAVRLPLYPALLAACYSLFGASDWPVIALQHLLSLAVYFALLRLLPARRDKLIFSGLFFLDVLYASYAHAVLPEAFFSFLLCMSAVSFRNFSVTGRWRHILLCGALVAAGAFTKPVLKFFPFFALPLFLAGSLPWRRRLAAAGLFLVFPLLVPALWSLRNYERTGNAAGLSFESLHYVGRAVNFAEFPEGSAVKPYFLQHRGEGPLPRKAKPGVIYATIADLKREKGMSEAEMGAEFSRIFRLSVLRHPLLYARDSAVEMFYFFFSAHNLFAKHALKEKLPASVAEGWRQGRYGGVLLKITLSQHPFYWALFLATLIFLFLSLKPGGPGLSPFSAYGAALIAYLALVTSMANEGLAIYRAPVQPFMLFFSALLFARAFGTAEAGKAGVAAENGNFDWDRFWTVHRVSAAEAWLISERDAILNRTLDGLGEGPKKVLEVGCGAASNLRLLARSRKDAACYALDSSPEAIARLKGEIPNAVLGDCFRTPFADGEFDLVYSAGLMEHFPDEAPFAAEMRRILRPGGRIVTFVPGRYTLWQLHQLLLFTLLSGGYERAYSYSRLRSVFERGGFKIVDFAGLDPFSLQGALMRLLGRSFKPFFTKSLFRSAYTEICLICGK